MYQLGFVRQAVPSAFSLNRFASGVGTGAACDAARARKRLRGLGIRRRVQVLDRPKLGWDSLTDAELQVARLAAAGCTNRGIADRLFVSPHTVNTHLRHVFDKLDIRSRVDLTRIVERHTETTVRSGN
jgi:DNA-binding CsgD family transcriptional regulator